MSLHGCTRRLMHGPCHAHGEVARWIFANGLALRVASPQGRSFRVRQTVRADRGRLAVRLDSIVEIAAEADPAHRIERLLDAARQHLRTDDVTLALGERAVSEASSAGAGPRLAVPISGADGAPGELVARAAHADAFGPDDAQVLAVLGALVSGAVL